MPVGIEAGLTAFLGWAAESDWVPVDDHLLSRWGYPELRLAAAISILVVAGPELVRWCRVLATWAAPFATLGAVVLGSALPSGALAGLALGLGAGALVRLAFGSAAGVPPTARVVGALAALGVHVSDLAPAERQRVGYAEYVGHDAAGRPLDVRGLGRDAEDTQRLARRWRLLAYRDPPRSAPIGRLEQVEHEGLALFMAAQAGSRVPAVVIAALGRDGDALVVTRQPDVEPLELASADEVSDQTLLDLMRQVDSLHAAGISHGRLNLSNVLVGEDGPLLVDLSAATLGAPQSALDIDVAELLVACCVLVGPERTLAGAVEAGFGGALARVQPYLQRAALTPHTRDLARSHEVAELRRLRPKDVPDDGGARLRRSPGGSGPPRRPFRPASSRWESTSRAPSRSPSPTALPRSTFRPSGATSPCVGWAGRATSDERRRRTSARQSPGLARPGRKRGGGPEGRPPQFPSPRRTGRSGCSRCRAADTGSTDRC